jgi:hypothetical protein
MAALKRLKGAIHLHTTLSHDGKLSLEELVEFLESRGHDFICVSEHSYDIDRQAMLNLAEQCGKLSKPDFLIIPGLEFRCHDDIDILGYGVIEPCDSEDPATIIRHIKAHDGVPVLAHPTIHDYPLEREWISLLDGVELWNNQEGKFLPQARTIRKFAELHEWQPRLKAFYGIDLHRPKSYYPISTVIEAKENSRKEILEALRDGNFHLQSPLLKLDSSGKIGFTTRAYIIAGSALFNLLRSLRG